jgi:dsRNA-specific ribonuclease
MLAQAARVRLPHYRLLDRWGPPHQPMFRIEAAFEAPAGEVRATAEGPNRQAAEQEAARRILEQLDTAPPTVPAI